LNHEISKWTQVFVVQKIHLHLKVPCAIILPSYQLQKERLTLVN